ncbi:membrane associated rhomboid family serine protease [Sphingomonas vulcanisoli]|uniref:Membrane associated rhomboid family serine protease n=1 Tax=Sphingomonas vulcanisoli TaxID=1658060 RepID=A0ABX0TMT7_9SPHN|nr:membrane associated rhomboid family serine protease [Sphingomonas vulcanisoli]
MKTARPETTIAVAAVTVIAFFLVQATGQVPLADMLGGFVSARFDGLVIPRALPLVLTPLSATLLHAGLIHLGVNLLTLIFCGREVEVALGRWPTLLLYGIGAYAAAAMQFAVGPHSTVPMIGASGAISAFVGAYAMLYGQRRASNLSPALARWVHILWLAATWIGLQLLLGIAMLAGGIAVAAAAHVGGFFAGILLARPLLRWRYRRA